MIKARVQDSPLLRRLVLVLPLCLAAASANAASIWRGETFTCHFGKYGKAVIVMHKSGATLTVGGRKHELTSGSYFYQSDDGQVWIMFGPNWRWWEYNEIRDDHCVRRPRRR